MLSTFDNPAPNPPIPSNADIPRGYNIPLYRREVSLAAAIPSSALLYDHFIVGTLHQRVGEQEQIAIRTPERSYMNGAWFKVANQNGNYQNNGIYKSGPSFNYYFDAVQAGIDILREVKEGNNNILGVIGAYGKSHANVDHLNIINAGRDNFNAWTVGGYYTHYNPSGWYLDTTLLNTYHQIDANSQRGLPSIFARSNGLEAGIETGYNVALPYNIGFEPEAQFIAERLWINNTRTNPFFNFTTTNSLLGRLGLRISHNWETPASISNLVTVWLFGNVWHEFQGNSRVNFSSSMGDIPFSSDIGTSTGQIGLGMTALFSHGISLYATGNYNNNWNQHGHSAGGEVGMRINI